MFRQYPPKRMIPLLKLATSRPLSSGISISKNTTCVSDKSEARMLFGEVKTKQLSGQSRLAQMSSILFRNSRVNCGKSSQITILIVLCTSLCLDARTIIQILLLVKYIIINIYIIIPLLLVTICAMRIISTIIGDECANVKKNMSYSHKW